METAASHRGRADGWSRGARGHSEPARRELQACGLSLGFTHQFGDIVQDREALLAERRQVIVRRGRDAIFDVMNFTSDAVIQLKQRFEMRIGDLEPMDSLRVTGEFLLKGVVEMFELHAALSARLRRCSLIWRNCPDAAPLPAREHFRLIVIVRAFGAVARAPLADDARGERAIRRPIHYHHKSIAEIGDGAPVGIVVPAQSAQDVGRAFEWQVDIAAAQAQHIAERGIETAEMLT